MQRFGNRCPYMQSKPYKEANSLERLNLNNPIQGNGETAVWGLKYR